ncbi:ATP-binding cassette domain-containing protein [Planctomyces sp. SH-PL14]|uniref:ATP-binding cassette domain-containing protein n=1 Tax=Planctomyces sp. SH-PL14 TaxID=1632864 RepID=UPI000946741E|nr:ATP-binding cassette domain-containing protein [Planctomyces sp. SH-PL14]
MASIEVRDLSFTYGGIPLLDGISCSIEPGERIGLVGRNGAGKSTFMKLLSGDLRPDAGTIQLARGVRVARLTQDVPDGGDHTVFEEICGGLGAVGTVVARLRELHRTGNADPGELDRLHSELDSETGWQLEHRVEEIIDQMGLDETARFESLSSGMKRRVLLGKALAADPTVLLLDEPTNHLDIAAVEWLEEFLVRSGLTLVFVTHDRAFLQRIANRIIEVERGRLFDWTCDYKTFLVRREALLEAEAQQQALFDKKLAAEEVWVRTGIKARRTRNEGRVRALERMREERQKRRTQVGNVRVQVQDAERSGTLVASLDNVMHAFGDKTVLRNVSTTITRGDKVGIVGPNGAGKTTLLRTLLGDLKPQSGTVRLGSNLQIAYFDQLRAQLDEEKTAVENVGEGRDTVIVNGQGKHVVGYLQDFLFSPERGRTLVRYLSGGERNRLLLAKLFTRPANVFVLDEPTNDLDAETLELLEQLLVDFSGTILLVSHDREFLNNVVTSTLVFEGGGSVKEYAGGYDDWIRQRSAAPVAAAAVAPATTESKTASAPAAPATPAAAPRKAKLSYKEQKELDGLPGRIERLESDQAALHAEMSSPEFYLKAGPELAAASSRLAKMEAELQTAYTRWEELEGR